MAERPLTKPEIASQKRAIKLPPAIGDWTTYRPPKVLVKKIKTGLYGFDRLSKEESNLVLLVHYRFIQALLKSLKLDLGMGVEFFSCQVEQTTYLNFLRSLSGQVVQGKLSINGIHENPQVFFDLVIANSIINHALGSHDIEPLSRGLTEAENNIFTETLTEYLPKYALAFQNIFPDPAFSIVSSPDVTLDTSINPSSTFVAFSAEVAVNDYPPGKITMGYPGSALKGMIDAFLKKDKEKPLNFSRLSAAALNKILVPVFADLGKTSLFTSELHGLEIGDVVALDTLTSSAINLTLGNLLKLLVQPVIKDKKKKAVRIAGFREEEEIKLAPPIQVTEEKKPTAPAVEVPGAAPKPAPPEPIKKPPEEEELPEEELLEEEEEFPEEELFEEEEFPEEELFEEESPEEEKKEG